MGGEDCCPAGVDGSEGGASVGGCGWGGVFPSGGGQALWTALAAGGLEEGAAEVGYRVCGCGSWCCVQRTTFAGHGADRAGYENGETVIAVLFSHLKISDKHGIWRSSSTLPDQLHYRRVWLL